MTQLSSPQLASSQLAFSQVSSTQPTNSVNALTPEIEQQLEQLRDIHLPEPVSWFPMAMGWWLLIALLILALFLIYRKVQAHRRIFKNPAYLFALDELAQLKANANNDTAKLAGDLSALLKRVGLYHNLPIATLTGEAWASYLTQSGHSDAQFDKAQADFIANGAYIDYAIDYADDQQKVPDWQLLQATAHNWITEQFKLGATGTHKPRQHTHKLNDKEPS